MRNPSLIVALAFTAAACSPQSATLTSGSYTAFLAEATSVSLAREEVDLDGYDTYHQVDCRVFDTEELGEALRLGDRVQNCGAGDDGSEASLLADFDGDGLLDLEDVDDDNDGVFDLLDCDDNDAGVLDDGCAPGGGDGFWPPVDQFWLAADGFNIVTEDLDPWRGEGVVTHEGDLLVSFHHRLPGNADFWFQFAVDRFFQPTECVQDDNGEVIVAALDGDWVAEWSKDLDRIAALRDDEEAFGPYAHLDPFLDEGRMFYLNGRLTQLNPDQDSGNDEWFMPEQWSAGASQGKFSEELMVDYPPTMADPNLQSLLAQGYYASQIGNLQDFLYYCEMIAGTDPDPEVNDCMRGLESFMDERVVSSVAEMDYVMKPDVGDDVDPSNRVGPMRHLNSWRAVDGRPSGFDGWGEMYPSYVVFSGDSDLRIGGSARGAFTLTLSAVDSNSFVVVKGEFEIPEIKKDTWAPENLRESKRDEAREELGENAVTYCSRT